MNSMTEMKKNWLALFPEYKSSDKLSELLDMTLGRSLDELAAESEKIKNDVAGNKEIISYTVNAPVNEELAAISAEFSDNVSMYFFYEPILNNCLNKYSEKLKKYDFPVRIVIETVLAEISEISVKALVLAVNDARMQNKLVGDTPEERYTYFEKHILRDKECLIKLYTKYIELIRIISGVSDDCCNYFIEILENYKSDKSKFDVQRGKIIDINVGRGDRHNGKSVAFVTFEDGSKLIYKPHNIKPEHGFAKLIEKINKDNDGTLMDMIAVDALPVDDHGWVKIIKNEKVNTIQEVKDFYVRAGQLLCVLYTLNTVDCHFENIISHGPYPVIIDCETIFHPNIVGRNCGINLKNDSINDEVSRIIDKSVLKVGLLPNFMIGGPDNNKVFDIGGLGDCENMEFPFKQMKLVNPCRDDIKIEYDFFKAHRLNNCPVIDDKRYSCYDFEKELKHGFEAMYRWILSHKQEYLNAIDDYFGTAMIRLLFRATHIYSKLLLTSYHPDFLEDPVSRKILLSRIGINASAAYRDVIKLETLAMDKCNVPIFTCAVNSTDIYSENILALRDYFDKSPMAYVKEKVNEMSDSQLETQLEFISMSFSMHGGSTESDLTGIKFANTDKNSSSSKEWINIAKKIGDYLISASTSFSKDGDVHRNWVSCTLKGNSESPAEIAPVGYDIYNGSSGIILFLTKLSELSEDDKYYKAALESLNSIYSFIDELSETENCSVGLFNGISGYLYILNLVHDEDRNQKWNKCNEKLFRLIESSINTSDSVDVIGGLAGCVSALMNIYETAGVSAADKERCRTISEKCLKLIIDRSSLLSEGGRSWINSFNGSCMTGFAHGNAGIIAVLARAEKVFGRSEELDKLINDSLEFERTLYNRTDGNWRINNNEEKYGNGWCHGVPGILLEKAELIANDCANDDIYDEFDTALNTTEKHTFGIGPSLCHGDLGNIQIVHYAALVSGNKQLEQKCMDKLDEITQKVIIPRYKGRAFRGASAAGLMIGSAGFGYTLLRFICPDKVKMILGA